MARKKNVVQEHHLNPKWKEELEEEIGETVMLFQGEHWAITQLQRRKRISKGFIKALEYWINQVRHMAMEVKK